MKLKVFFSKYWQVILGSVVIFSLIFGLLGYRINDLTQGLANTEVEFIESSLTSSNLVENPLFIPQKAIYFAFNSFEILSVSTARLTSAFFAVITLILIFNLLIKWHTVRVSVIACSLLILSSWFVGLGRLGNGSMLLVLGITVIIYTSVFINSDTKKSPTKALLLLGISGLALYIPGLVWALFAMLFVNRKAVSMMFKHLSITQKFLGLLIVLALSTPVVVISIAHVEYLLAALGVPAEFLVIDWLRRLVVIPIYLFAQGPLDPATNLGRLPLLDIFSTVLFVFGIYAFYFKQKLPVARTLAAIFITASILVALNGSDFMPMLIPVIFIAMASGVELLLQQWLTIFPRNPLARQVGVGLMIITVAFVGFYHIQRYFVAWAGSEQTHKEFIYSIDD